MEVGTWQTEASTTTATFDNFNISPASPTSSITDDWSSGTINTTKWNNWGSPQTSVVSSQLQIASLLGGGYFGLDSSAGGVSQDLTGSSVTNKLINAGNQSLTSWEVYPIMMKKADGTNNQMLFFVSNNTVYARKVVAGVSTDIHTAAYSSSNHIYFRVRESGGTIYYDTSANGSTWTNFASTTNPFDISHVVVGMEVGTWN